MRRLLNLNAVRAFEMAARYESFVQAAAELGVTQAAVSRHVRNLELELGIALFKRFHRSISLTYEGRAYAERISEGLSYIDGQGRKRSLKGSRRVVLDADSDLTATWLLPRLTQATLSKLNVELDLRSRLEWPRLLPADTDLAIIWGGYESPRFKSAPFLEGQAFAVSAPLLADGRAPPCAASDFSSYPLIHERTDGWWRRMLFAQGIPAEEVSQDIFLHRTYLVAEAAARGLGLAIGDDVIFADNLKAGRLVRLPGPVMQSSRLFVLLEPFGRRVPDCVLRVRDWLVAEATAHRKWQAKFAAAAD